VKSQTITKMIGATLVALSIGVAHAQTDAGASTPAAVSSASAPGSAKAARKQMRAENRALAKRVRQALGHTKGLTSSGINVIAKSGTITLAGTVPDQPQMDLAVTTAKGVTGVSSVKNSLTFEVEGN
jgi:hyperosmotically inducible periplasmic protein